MSDKFEAWVNPLQWIELEINVKAKHADEHSLLQFLVNPGDRFSLQSAISRYASINGLKHHIFVAPNHDEFLKKLIWPLRSAKSSYLIGNFISTIAQCGMVAEMVALLWYEISDFSVNGSGMNEEQEIQLFGSRFEKLGQERRVDILKGFNLIDDEQKGYFDRVRVVRRRYLHFFSQSHESIETDSLNAFDSTLALVAKLMDISFNDGKVSLRPSLMRYVERHEKV